MHVMINDIVHYSIKWKANKKLKRIIKRESICCILYPLIPLTWIIDLLLFFFQIWFKVFFINKIKYSKLIYFL